MSAIITLTCVFHHLHAVIHVLVHMHASTDGIADPGFARQGIPTTKWGVNLLFYQILPENCTKNGSKFCETIGTGNA